MHHFHYKDGVLHAEDVLLARLAAEVGTPFYCYSTATLERHYRVLQRGLRRPGRADLLCRQGQLQPGRACARWRASAPAWTSSRKASCAARARPACRPTRSSSPASARRARRWPMRWARASSASMSRASPSCEALSEVAASLGRTARIAMRVNPDVDAKTHAKISTGKAENKFGMPYRAGAARSMPRPRKLPGIEVAGIHMHIGSQITDLEPFRNAFRLMRELAASCSRDGHTHPPSRHRRRPRRALLRTATTCRRSPPDYAARRQGDARRSRAQDRPGAGPHDRRQRRHARDARHLRARRARQDLHHRRRAP